MINTQILRTLFHYSRVQLALMMAIATIVFYANFKVFSVIDDPKGQLWLHFIVTGIVIAMFAAHFVVPIIHLSRHHLWRIDPIYRTQHTIALLMILLAIVSFQAMLVSTSINEFCILLLSNSAIALLMLQVHFAFRIIEKLIIIPVFVAIIAIGRIDQFNLLAAVILFLGSALLFYKSWRESRHRQRELTTMFVDIWDFSSTSQAWSKMRIQNWAIRTLGKNINWRNKDLKWGINLPINQFGFMPILFFVIVLAMSFGKNTGEVSDFLIIVYTLSISISLPLESSSLLKQLRPVFHLYPQRQQLIQDIIRTIDKMILKQSLLFLALIAIAASVFEWELDLRYTITATIATFMLNRGLYPALLGSNIKNVTLQGLFFGLAYLGTVWAILYTLHFAGNIRSTVMMFSGYLIVFLLLRKLTTRFVYQRSLEQLTAGSCLGAIK